MIDQNNTYNSKIITDLDREISEVRNSDKLIFLKQIEEKRTCLLEDNLPKFSSDVFANLIRRSIKTHSRVDLMLVITLINSSLLWWNGEQVVLNRQDYSKVINNLLVKNCTNSPDVDGLTLIELEEVTNLDFDAFLEIFCDIKTVEDWQGFKFDAVITLREISKLKIFIYFDRKNKTFTFDPITNRTFYIYEFQLFGTTFDQRLVLPGLGLVSDFRLPPSFLVDKKRDLSAWDDLCSKYSNKDAVNLNTALLKAGYAYCGVLTPDVISDEELNILSRWRAQVGPDVAENALKSVIDRCVKPIFSNK